MIDDKETEPRDLWKYNKRLKTLFSDILREERRKKVEGKKYSEK